MFLSHPMGFWWTDVKFIPYSHCSLFHVCPATPTCKDPGSASSGECHWQKSGLCCFAHGSQWGCYSTFAVQKRIKVYRYFFASVLSEIEQNRTRETGIVSYWQQYCSHSHCSRTIKPQAQNDVEALDMGKLTFDRNDGMVSSTINNICG